MTTPKTIIWIVQANQTTPVILDYLQTLKTRVERQVNLVFWVPETSSAELDKLKVLNPTVFKTTTRTAVSSDKVFEAKKTALNDEGFSHGLLISQTLLIDDFGGGNTQMTNFDAKPPEDTSGLILQIPSPMGSSEVEERNFQAAILWARQYNIRVVGYELLPIDTKWTLSASMPDGIITRYPESYQHLKAQLNHNNIWQVPHYEAALFTSVATGFHLNGVKASYHFRNTYKIMPDKIVLYIPHNVAMIHEFKKLIHLLAPAGKNLHIMFGVGKDQMRGGYTHEEMIRLIYAKELKKFSSHSFHDMNCPWEIMTADAVITCSACLHTMIGERELPCIIFDPDVPEVRRGNKIRIHTEEELNVLIDELMQSRRHMIELADIMMLLVAAKEKMTDFWKDKHILVYIALAHHTRFISPVMETLKDRGATVDYVIGQAERSQEITAINLGLNYTHVFDWLSEGDRPEVQENYLRMRNVLSKSLNTSFLYSASPTTVIDKTIRAAAMEYIGFRNLIEKIRPSICFALHELNRWGKMFSFWAKKFNIPVLTFQEGLYCGLDFARTGHVQNSTLNLVWGERIKKQLTSYEAPKDRIIPVGNTHLAGEKRHQENNNIREKKRKEYQCEDYLAILLIFSGDLPNAKQLEPLFKAVTQSKGKKLYIKFHPSTRDTQVNNWVASIPNALKEKIKFFTGNDSIYNLLSMCDLAAITQASTTGLEAIFFGVPLILLDVQMSQPQIYSFEQFNVATKMTPQAFGDAISQNLNFKGLIKKEDIHSYLQDELSGTTTAIDNVICISREIIEARQAPDPPQLHSIVQDNKKWSIIIELPALPDLILRQLETVAVNSENSGKFEVILLEPDRISKESAAVLDTLKGDIIRIKRKPESPVTEAMNHAATIASGTTLVFLSKNLLPQPDWLNAFDKGIKEHKRDTIFGARIVDIRGSILHSGIIVDQNNAPITAYKHLPSDYPKVLKERSFKMIDHTMAVNRRSFCKLGGFWEKCGRYGIMEFCLRAGTEQIECIYLPGACLVSLETDMPEDPSGAIHFYGKWHGILWDHHKDFYKDDQTTLTELDTARLSQTMAKA